MDLFVSSREPFFFVSFFLSCSPYFNPLACVSRCLLCVLAWSWKGKKKKPRILCIIGPFLVAPEWKGQPPQRAKDYARQKQRERERTKEEKKGDLSCLFRYCGGDLIEVEAGKIILDVFRNFPLAVGFSFVRNFIERFFSSVTIRALIYGYFTKHLFSIQKFKASSTNSRLSFDVSWLTTKENTLKKLIPMSFDKLTALFVPCWTPSDKVLTFCVQLLLLFFVCVCVRVRLVLSASPWLATVNYRTLFFPRLSFSLYSCIYSCFRVASLSSSPPNRVILLEPHLYVVVWRVAFKCSSFAGPGAWAIAQMTAGTP